MASAARRELKQAAGAGNTLEKMLSPRPLQAIVGRMLIFKCLLAKELRLCMRTDCLGRSIFARAFLQRFRYEDYV